MSYDFTGASKFLSDEACITPEELYEEIVGAMATVSALENKRNRKAVHSIWGTLLTCADFIERIIDKRDNIIADKATKSTIIL